MTQYNSLHVKLSNSQLSKLKSAIKNKNDVVLRLSSNMTGNSDDNTNLLINYYWIIDKFQVLVKLLLKIHQRILCY